MLLILVVAVLQSCSNKFNKSMNYVNDHGGYALKDKKDLPSVCDEKYPCITTANESSDSSWQQKDSANKAVIKALKQTADSLREAKNKVFVVKDSASCAQAIQYYIQALDKYSKQVDELSDQITESTNTFNKKVEKLTIESTAKLAAVQVNLERQKDTTAFWKSITAATEKLYQDQVEKTTTAEDLAQTRLWIIIAICVGVVALGFIGSKLKWLKFL